MHSRPTLDGGPLAPEHRSQGAGRAGDGGRQDHVPGDTVEPPCLASQASSSLRCGVARRRGGRLLVCPPACRMPTSTAPPQSTRAAAERKILYYRDPSGAPYWSAEPKKDADGRDYLPVYEDEEVSFEPGERRSTRRPHSRSRKILYYRNPMGLPDTSPVPKKDWMGMDYIAVYEGEEQDDGKTVKVSLDKVQRSGRAHGSGRRRASSFGRSARAARPSPTSARSTSSRCAPTASSRSSYVNETGQHVHAGEPLFRVYSPDMVQAQVDYRSRSRPIARRGGRDATSRGAMQQLRNLGVPESRIDEVRETGASPRTHRLAVAGRPASSWRSASSRADGRRPATSSSASPTSRTSGSSPTLPSRTSAAITRRHARRASRSAPIPASRSKGAVDLHLSGAASRRRARARCASRCRTPTHRIKHRDVCRRGDRRRRRRGRVSPCPISAVIDSGNRQVVLIVEGRRPLRAARRSSSARAATATSRSRKASKQARRSSSRRTS